MATAKKLPSGSWRCQVYSHTEEIPQPDGTIRKKRIYESFTCDDPSPKGKRYCEKAAADWAAKKEETNRSGNITFGEALDKYIAARENLLSVRTISNYRRIRKKEIQGIMDVPVRRITQEIIQEIVNEDSLVHSPKTVRDNHGLIAAVLKLYRPDLPLHTVLPKKVRPDIYIPSDADIQRLMRQVKDTEMELPVLLSIFGPMRRGEISALRIENICGNVVHVCENMVIDEYKNWVVKTPKSYSGDRYIEYPKYVSEKWKGVSSGRVVLLNPDIISCRFTRILKSAGLPHFRFHDLRHYSASVQHTLGIPDAYIMQRGGWGNDGVLKDVYRHALEDRQKEMNAKANNYFENLCNTTCNTQTKSP